MGVVRARSSVVLVWAYTCMIIPCGMHVISARASMVIVRAHAGVVLPCCMGVVRLDLDVDTLQANWRS